MRRRLIKQAIGGMDGVTLRDTRFAIPRQYRRDEERLIVSREAEL